MAISYSIMTRFRFLVLTVLLGIFVLISLSLFCGRSESGCGKRGCRGWHKVSVDDLGQVEGQHFLLVEAELSERRGPNDFPGTATCTISSGTFDVVETEVTGGLNANLLQAAGIDYIGEIGRRVPRGFDYSKPIDIITIRGFSQKSKVEAIAVYKVRKCVILSVTVARRR